MQPIERLVQDQTDLAARSNGSFYRQVAAPSVCLAQQIRNLTWNLCASKPVEIRDQRWTNARITGDCSLDAYLIQLSMASARGSSILYFSFPSIPFLSFPFLKQLDADSML